MVNPATRFNGKTKIDALHIDSEAWYIDGVQVIASAADINQALRTYPIYNATGGALSIGMPLHISGYDATSGYYAVEKADANAGKRCHLFAQDAAASKATTDAKSYYTGTANGIDCSGGAAVGDPVYLSATVGTLTLTKPTAADTFVQIVGRVGSILNPGTLVLDVSFQEISEIGYNEIAPLAFSGLTGVTPDMAADKLVISDATDSKNKTVTLPLLATGLAGGVSSSGLTAASGVLKVDPGEIVAAVSTDYFAFFNTDGNLKKDAIADVVAGMAGIGMIAASGQLAVSDNGQYSHGGVFFTGAGDCTSITVGPTAVYPRSISTQDNPVGQWSSASGTASGCATALAAAINGDKRNNNGPYYSAEAIGAGVIIRGVTPGNSNATVTRTDAAEPSAVQDLVLGYNASTIQIASIYHVVTAFDLMLTSFTLQTPFALNTFIVQVLTSAGVIRSDLTDTFTFGTIPAGVLVTSVGGTHLQAGDIITVLSISL